MCSSSLPKMTKFSGLQIKESIILSLNLVHIEFEVRLQSYLVSLSVIVYGKQVGESEARNAQVPVLIDSRRFS
jgi:hypothetical protein